MPNLLANASVTLNVPKGQAILIVKGVGIAVMGPGAGRGSPIGVQYGSAVGPFDNDRVVYLTARTSLDYDIRGVGEASNKIAYIKFDQAVQFDPAELRAMAAAGTLNPGSFYYNQWKELYQADSYSSFKANVVVNFTGSAPGFGSALMAPGAGLLDAGLVTDESLVIGNSGLEVIPEFNWNGKISKSSIVSSEYLPAPISQGTYSATLGFRGPNADFTSGIGFGAPLAFSGTMTLNGNYTSSVGQTEMLMTVSARARTIGAVAAPLLNVDNVNIGQLPLTFAAGVFTNCVFIGELTIRARTFTTGPFTPQNEVAVFRRHVILTTDSVANVTLKQLVLLGTDYKDAALSTVAMPAVTASTNTLAITATGIAAKSLDWVATLSGSWMISNSDLFPPVTV